MVFNLQDYSLSIIYEVGPNYVYKRQLNLNARTTIIEN